MPLVMEPRVKLWERIRWIGEAAGIIGETGLTSAGTFAAPFIFLLLFNVVLICLVVPVGILATLFGWSTLYELGYGAMWLGALVDGFGVWFVIIWTLIYALVMLVDYVARRK